jgi:protein-tyrosine phosphatase
MSKYRVLFVCTGNICRSPTADGVLRKMVADLGLADVVEVDSAGTHDYHVGEPPDSRSQEHARKRGYDLSALRARQVQTEDFEQFDLILALDDGHLKILQRLCPPKYKSKIHRFTEFCTRHKSHDVPDPYYDGAQGFEDVLDLVEDGCEGIMGHIRKTLPSKFP